MVSESDDKTQVSETVSKIMLSFRNAVFSEMYYLRDNGGRRYRVSNGQRIGKTDGTWAYGFEMESELYLAEDSPITLTAGGESSKGSVLSCEDFQIIVLLEKDLGVKVASAHISVEPWKLLESMNERLESFGPSSKVALSLMQEGPAAATRRPIQDVDTGQDAAMRHALRDPITVIWGPPGTGKTHTMSEIAIRFLSEGKSVLAVSHSNVSVDGIASKVAELMRAKGLQDDLEKGKVLRYGFVRDEELSKDPDVTSYNAALKSHPGDARRLENLNKRREKLKAERRTNSQDFLRVEKEIKAIRKAIAQEEKECVLRARMVATTASRLYSSNLFKDSKYDVVMFDEASMAYVPQVACAALFSREKLICVGDFRQLPPIAQGPSAKKALSMDIFRYLGICDSQQKPYYHPWLVMLDEQRRMHPSISAFPGRAFYNGMLKDHESVLISRTEVAGGTPYPGYAANLIDLSGTYCFAGKNSDNSRFNVMSAAVSFALAITAEADNKCTVGVIAPYAAQVRLVRAMIQDYRSRGKNTDVSCATVHQFQGSERDVILLDAVESMPSIKPGILMADNENGSVDRLVNVAVTRARGKLVTVAPRIFWEQRSDSRNSVRKLIEHHMAYDNVASVKDGLPDLLEDIDFGPNIGRFLDVDQAREAFLHDVSRAARKIVLSIPDGAFLPDYEKRAYDAIYEKKLRGVDVALKCRNWKELPEDWKGLGWQSDDADSPIVVIDDKIVWHGMPLSRGRNADSKGRGGQVALQVPLRITGAHTVEMIRSLTDIESREVDGRKSALKPRIGESKQDDKGRGVDGFALYVSQKMRCPKCKSPMKLAKSFKKGTHYARCTKCDETQLIDKGFLAHYISVKQVRCPQCHSYLTARVSSYGLYARCDEGHNVKLDQI